MLSVDQLVDQIYEDRLISTPLFQTTQAKYYKMVVAAFEQRPNRAGIPWVTTPAIYDVEFSTGAPVYSANCNY
jgi:hypothetical protein